MPKEINAIAKPPFMQEPEMPDVSGMGMVGGRGMRKLTLLPQLNLQVCLITYHTEHCIIKSANLSQ